MKERPILFNGEMVRAILDGRKTQTRRPVKPQPEPVPDDVQRWSGDDPSRLWWAAPGVGMMVEFRDMSSICPFGAVGDRLWVRETWRIDGLDRQGALKHGREACGSDGVSCRADCESDSALIDGPWIPSIHMPRWASRITLEITAVRVERIRDISEEDAKADGADIMRHCDDGCWIICGPWLGNYRTGFNWLWNAAYPGSWDRNDWVWVIEFKRVEVAK